MTVNTTRQEAFVKLSTTSVSFMIYSPPRSHFLSVAFALILAGWALAQERPSQILTDKNVPVPMRDGTILRADIYRPAAGGPFPVLVFRTPYGKPAKVDEALVNAGFIVVQQDARGRYASDGEYESYVRYETHDG